MPEHPKISALWFTKEGHGPNELALRIHPFGGEPEAPEHTLGIQVLPDDPDGDVVPMIFHNTEMVGGGFHMARDRVQDLHRQIGAWLTRTGATPPDENLKLENAALAGAASVLLSDCATGTAHELLAAFGLTPDDIRAFEAQHREGRWDIGVPIIATARARSGEPTQ